MSYFSEFDKLVSVFKELQIPLDCQFNGSESCVDTPFCSYRFVDGAFVEVLKRDVDCVGRGGTSIGWREGSKLGAVAGEAMIPFEEE